MRLIAILALLAFVLVGFCSPALPAEKKKKNEYDLFSTTPAPSSKPNVRPVTVIQGSKRYAGYSMDNGRFFIENDNGKTIMDGWINRMGAVQLFTRDDSFVGQLNPMGNALLMSPNTYDTIRIEVER